MIELLIFAFPALIFFGGAYLIVRGLGMKGGRKPLLSGRARASEKLESAIAKETCVYFKTAVEYYQGGHQPWRSVLSVEKRVPFSVEGTMVDPEFADFSVRESMREEGYVRRDKGMLEQFGEMLAKSQPGRLARSVATAVTFTPGAAEEVGEAYLDSGHLEAILRIPGAKGKLRTCLKKPLRITERVLPEGSPVSVAGGEKDGKSLHGMLGSPLLISDGGQDDAAGRLAEKAFMSIALGAGLMIIALAVFAILTL